MAREDWETTSGLLDDFDFEVTGASFGQRDDYANGEVLLAILTGVSPDSDEDVELIYSCGKGWEARDGGRHAESPTGKRKFNVNSAYAALFRRVFELVGEEVYKNDPKQIEMWVGWKFHMKREEKDFGGTIGKHDRTLPVAILEVGGKKGKGGTSSASGRSNGKARNTASSSSSEGGDNPLVADLVAKAKIMPLAAFRAYAFSKPEVVSDGELLQSIISDADDSFWNTHHE